MSTITGNTTESKAEAYAIKSTLKVASQYDDKIDAMKTEMKTNEDKMSALALKLDQAMQALTSTADKTDEDSLGS